MRRLLIGIFGLMVLGAGSAAIFSVEPLCSDNVSAQEMGLVVGGAKCEICFDFCGGGGAKVKCAKDGSDDGELCGSAGGLGGSAWDCKGSKWGATKDDDCDLSGGSTTCKAILMHCDEHGNCNTDSNYSNPSGSYQCDD
ncbi:MAG: hypothetical protein JSU94_20885 [Phycisphaerales bacterium]|nr:MAG: hypothetical protein JSU94_20885 [Phycisphaerales bacterium]